MANRETPELAREPLAEFILFVDLGRSVSSIHVPQVQGPLKKKNTGYSRPRAN